MLSNSTLCHATLDAKLDKFIRTKAFTGRKWKPPYVDELVSADEVAGKRKMSTKMLADIVESLTGAAYEDAPMGQKMDNALQCLRLLLPGAWHGLNEGRHALQLLIRPSSTLPSMLEPLEEMIGYRFRNKTLLIDATTHASYQGGGVASSSRVSADQTLERLEFIGDAILDYVLVRALWNYTNPLPQHAMTELRAACVNADLLGFLAMEWTVERPTAAIGPAGLPVAAAEPFPFWSFMRYSHAEIGLMQRAAMARHARERQRIRDAMEGMPAAGEKDDDAADDDSSERSRSRSRSRSRAKKTYPWAQLARLRPPKFFSDMVESVLGAVWMDSGGDASDPDGAAMRPCVDFVERLGVLPYLRRLLAERVDVIHPKNKLGMLADSERVRYEVSTEDGGVSFRHSSSSSSSTSGGVQDDNHDENPGEPNWSAAAALEDNDDNMEDLEMTEEAMIEEQLYQEQLYQEMEAAARLHDARATRWACKVLVGEKLVVEMGGGLHKDEIITRAAERAYEVLRRRKRRTRIRNSRSRNRSRSGGRIRSRSRGRSEQGDEEEVTLDNP
jgi:dsRNA-specific ribonuclease